MDWNFWHWVRLPSLGDIRELRASNEKNYQEIKTAFSKKADDLVLSARNIFERCGEISNNIHQTDAHLSNLEKSLHETLRGKMGEIAFKVGGLSSSVASVRDEWRRKNEANATRDEKRLESIMSSFGKLGEDISAKAQMLAHDFSVGSANLDRRLDELCSQTKEFEKTLFKEGRAGFERLAKNKDSFEQSASAFFANGGEALNGLAKQVELTAKQIDEIIAIAASLREVFDLFLVNNLIDKLETIEAKESPP